MVGWETLEAGKIVVNPVVLGTGRTMFDSMRRTLKRTKTRTFGHVNALRCYERMA